MSHKGKTVRVQLIDLGPSPPPRAHACIDLTAAAFRALAGSLAPGAIIVDFRVLDGARHCAISKPLPPPTNDA